MNARYWQRGETLDYTATGAVTNGQVVSLGNRTAPRPSTTAWP